jgi:hypothetical protein
LGDFFCAVDDSFLDGRGIIKVSNKVKEHKTMKRTISIALTTVIALGLSINNSAMADTTGVTKVMAMGECSNYQKSAVIDPEYGGVTRGGLDIWICYDRTVALIDPGPYAVLICDLTGCQIIDWTY